MFNYKELPCECEGDKVLNAATLNIKVCLVPIPGLSDIAKETHGPLLAQMVFFITKIINAP